MVTMGGGEFDAPATLSPKRDPSNREAADPGESDPEESDEDFDSESLAGKRSPEPGKLRKMGSNMDMSKELEQLEQEEYSVDDTLANMLIRRYSSSQLLDVGEEDNTLAGHISRDLKTLRGA